MYNKNNNPKSSESEKQSLDDRLFRLIFNPPQSSEDKKKLFSDIWHQLTDDPLQSSVSERRKGDFSIDKEDFSIDLAQNEKRRLELEHKRAEEDIKDIQIVREERKKYANNAFGFMCIYVVVVIAITIWVSFGLSLPSTPLAVLISTIPASMALFGWVLRGLFPTDKK